jgi:hypothetical protein
VVGDPGGRQGGTCEIRASFGFFLARFFWFQAKTIPEGSPSILAISVIGVVL